MNKQTLRAIAPSGKILSRSTTHAYKFVVIALIDGTKGKAQTNNTLDWGAVFWTTSEKAAKAKARYWSQMIGTNDGYWGLWLEITIVPVQE